MIKITKIAKPNILQENDESWRDELLGKISRGETISDSLKTRYNNPETKRALKQETNSKCMYCESKVSHVAHEHIEHIKPKSTYPQFTFDWNNLGLACPICNMNKGDDYNESLPFINPYSDNPSEHFRFLGIMLHRDAGNRRAELTERTIRLNRPELIEQRKERIEKLQDLADKYTNEGNAALKKALLQELKIECSPSKPYSAFAQAVFGGVISIKKTDGQE
jgi:uncharacterized protein (TIGR02646 family)